MRLRIHGGIRPPLSWIRNICNRFELEPFSPLKKKNVPKKFTFSGFFLYHNVLHLGRVANGHALTFLLAPNLTCMILNHSTSQNQGYSLMLK